MSALVKVCGLTRPEQVAEIDAMGVDFVGFVFAPESPRRATAAHVASIARGNARRVGVFTGQDAQEVNRIMAWARLDMAQLHGGQDADFCRAVGPSRVIKVFWPERYALREEFLRDLDGFGALCELMLLDAGASGGGSGKSLDFAALAGTYAPKPWILAGGLTPENVRPALQKARPAGVDLNSGVEESWGVKDIAKVRRAVRVVKKL